MNSHPEIKPKALSADDAAQYIGVGKTTLYGLFKKKKLKPIKVGRKTLIMLADLDAFLESLINEAA